MINIMSEKDFIHCIQDNKIIRFLEISHRNIVDLYFLYEFLIIKVVLGSYYINILYSKI